MLEQINKIIHRSREFVEVRSEVQRAMYSECLVRLGIAPTALETFNIDGIGWSPEIADEKDNAEYLSAGSSNPMGVIISPEQRRLGLCHPFHSFEQNLVEKYFETFSREIADITLDTGIALQLSHNLSRYRQIDDYLLLKSVVVHADIGALDGVFLQQRDLVRRFLTREYEWSDENLRQKIITSATRDGDLRQRLLDIPDWTYTTEECFYSSAFGGVYVLPSPRFNEIAIIFEDESNYPDKGKLDANLFHIENKRLIRYLFDKGYIELSPDIQTIGKALLEHKRECLVAEYLCRNNPDINYAKLNRAQRQQLWVEVKDKPRQLIEETEKALAVFSSEGNLDARRWSEEFRLMIAVPSSELSAAGRDTLWKLLSVIGPEDVGLLFRYNPDGFCKRFIKWPRSYQDWAYGVIGGGAVSYS